MSDHKKPMSAELEAALRTHHLPTDKPSVLADSFRHGWHAAMASTKPLGRTDAEIVERTEAAARFLALWKYGLEPEDVNAKLRHSQNTKAQHAWDAACKLQEILTDSDAVSASQEVDDCTEVVTNPIQQGLDAQALKKSFREYLSVSEHINAGGHAMDSIAADLTRIALAEVQQGVQPNECAQDVFNDGVSIGLFDIPKHTANEICAGISTATGVRVDWHYVGGRVHLKALPAANPTHQDAREFPAMTPELASILGLMCFQCISFAQALRAGGQQINTRAEDEQAAVLHWMLGHYFRHGEAWRDAAAEDMERMKAQAKQGEQA